MLQRTIYTVVQTLEKVENFCIPFFVHKHKHFPNSEFLSRFSSGNQSKFSSILHPYSIPSLFFGCLVVVSKLLSLLRSFGRMRAIFRPIMWFNVVQYRDPIMWVVVPRMHPIRQSQWVPPSVIPPII